MLDASVKGCTEIFHQEMELWTILQEDPTLQKIGTYIQENQRKFDELRAIAGTLVLVKHFTHLIEGKQLQTHIEELHRKEALLKART